MSSLAWSVRTLRLSSVPCELIDLIASPALEEIGQDLSRERVAEFNAEISRLFAEKTSRQVQVQTLINEIRTLWDELCTDLSGSDELEKAVRLQIP